MKGNSALRLGERTIPAVDVEVKVELGHFNKGNLRMHILAFCKGQLILLLALDIRSGPQAATKSAEAMCSQVCSPVCQPHRAARRTGAA